MSAIAGVVVDPPVVRVFTGPQTAAELKRLAMADGIHERTLLRAKAKLELVTRRAGFGAEGVWLW